ncbi:MAG: hypothetical protein IPK29_16875 [Betaproteobacteria bacterium]|nr:hypothetical protein [Betaproteobacteria bacterium]
MLRTALLIPLAAFALAAPALAQYPVKPVRVIVQFPAGARPTPSRA